ncbi:MAG: bifunctional phosphoribosylaminoimidazolecarboxamide formyltransferase/IMP cyclohydrolase [Thermoplasmata archaeon]|uniref:Bifunctional phosphoribosylaminoimidazolecarboxamide formyltransferase/IMP cyclohydrolase n=1 Tax=Candidatus Sysuiplasma superficiale TaxID=2823368 RepID=A0A8J7YPY1_9ARCH|nr:bifunctional phosphoribosylaminoimidazolecarboxamide formyltransferase/IMP cyclohydrolase [Candidatus Sysuiplasma superficiale]MBX8644110.1 bifunctional phosphoribosylaminoimidazolecarboxamide formyltransferase/IMP cyclohydrolase [Candidatus Sysuiplasma superficiale]
MNAIISVHDKSGILDLSSLLREYGVSLYATDGTSDYLEAEGISVTRLSNITGFSGLMDGRVKTLHPAIYAAILSDPENAVHTEQLRSLPIPHVEMVVSNLYPFERIPTEGASIEKLVKNIDIGGVTLMRAAAKNFTSVAAVTDPEQYASVIDEIRRNNGCISDETLRELSVSAFQRTSYYDSLISSVFAERFQTTPLPRHFVLAGKKRYDLKYGENPYQKAAAYECFGRGISVLNAQFGGTSALSYNNLMDASITVDVLREFSRPCGVVVKHANPSGVAVADETAEALREAYGADTISAYGSVIGVNRQLNAACAEFLSDKFVEVLIAPGYDEEALTLLARKKKLRILKTDFGSHAISSNGQEVRMIAGGFLVQEVVNPSISRSSLRVVTERKPTEEEIEAMLFANKVVRYLWSNAIVLADGEKTVGIGAGQSSRVDAVKLAVMKSRGKSSGSVMASDAFFPFRDGIDEAAKGGVTAVIQPGGSIRDREVIDAANENGMAMVFTDTRLFRH